MENKGISPSPPGIAVILNLRVSFSFQALFSWFYDFILALL